MWSKCAALSSASPPEDPPGLEATPGMREKEGSPGSQEKKEKLETLEDLGTLDPSATRA